MIDTDGWKVLRENETQLNTEKSRNVYRSFCDELKLAKLT